MDRQIIKVLIIDDAQSVEALGQTLLQLDEFTIETVASSTLADALKHAAGDHFDLIFTDVVLPDASGREIFKKLRQVSPNSAVIWIAQAQKQEKEVENLSYPDEWQLYILKNKYPLHIIRLSMHNALMQKTLAMRRQEYYKASELYRVVFDNSAVAITVTDAQERIISWNKFTEDLLGMEKEDLYMKPVSSFYPEHEWKRIRSLDIRQSGMRHHLETVMFRKDGSRLEVDISITVLKDTEGKITGSIGIIRDISERRKVEKVLQDKARRSDVTIKLMQDLRPDIQPEDMLGIIVRAAKSLVVADTASIILLAAEKGAPQIVASETSDMKVDSTILNPTLDEKKSITGWVVANKKPLLLFGSAQDDARFKDITWKKGIKCSINVPLIYKDSIKGTLNMNITTSDRLFTEDDLDAVVALGNHAAIALENSGLFTTMKQKSEEKVKTVSRKLEKAESQLIQAEKMAAVGQLASGVAHEINNPLSGVLGNIQIIMMEMESGAKIDDMKELLKIIEDSAKRCKSITQNLLDFSRSKSEKLEPFDIHAAIDKTIMLVDYSLKNSEIEIVKDFGREIPLVCANVNEMQQIFLNLISNAKWAIEKKAQKPSQIVISTRKADDDFVEVAIKDTGIGMSEEVATRIFEPFFTTKEVGKGTGLGLSLCIDMMKRNNGNVRVESTEGEGTTFFLTVPIAK